MGLEDLVKVTVVAKEIGVSHKTIYNWINDGHLKLARRGYVIRAEAWAVWEFMQCRRVEISYFISAYGTKRDAYGRFSSGSTANG